MRIKYIVPFPFDEAGIANRAAQLPDELRTPGVEYDFVPVKNSCHNADGPYEMADPRCVHRRGRSAERGGGLRRGRDGHGLRLGARGAALAPHDPGRRPRPGPAARRGDPRQEVLDPDDVAALDPALREDDGRVRHRATIARRSGRSTSGRIRSSCSPARRRSCSPRSRSEGRTAIEEDGADVILIGSTTMHQAVEHLRRTLGVPGHQPRTARDQDGGAVRPARPLALEGRLLAARDDPGREAAVARGSNVTAVFRG